MSDSVDPAKSLREWPVNQYCPADEILPWEGAPESSIQATPTIVAQNKQMFGRHCIRAVDSRKVRCTRNYRDYVSTIVIRAGVNPLKGVPSVQDLPIDHNIWGPDLDDVVLQSNEPFDVEFASRRPKLGNVGRVEHDNLPAVRLAEMVAELVDEDMIATAAI